MGDVAKAKIKATVRFLNGEDDNNFGLENAEQVIEYVGDPLIKIKHGEMMSDYNEKHCAKVMTEEERTLRIQVLEAELKLLKKKR